MSHIPLSRDQVTAIVKAIRSPEMSYLQGLDAFAKIAGFENQAAMMATLKAEASPSPVAPETAKPSPLTKEEKDSLFVHEQELRYRTLDNVIGELAKVTLMVESLTLQSRTLSERESMVEIRSEILEHLSWKKALETRKRQFEIDAAQAKSEPFRAVIAFGDMLSSTISTFSEIPEDHDGDLSEVSFRTSAELRAYLKGVDDGCGWLDYTVAATDSGNSAHGNDENPGYFEALKETPGLPFRVWFNENAVERDMDPDDNDIHP